MVAGGERLNKVAIAVGTVIAVVVVAALGIMLMNGSNGSGQPQTENSVVLPSGSTNNQNPNVTITYGKGATCPAGSLYIDVHIKNNGYANFTPSGSSFELTINGVVYQYWYSGSQLLGWRSTDIADGGRYDASIAFQVPDSTAPFVLSYNSASTDYNIVCRTE